MCCVSVEFVFQAQLLQLLHNFGFLVLLRNTVLCCAALCCALLCCTVLCCAVLCCAVLCCVVLCCAVLCCAVAILHCAVPCRAMPCHAVPCRNQKYKKKQDFLCTLFAAYDYSVLTQRPKQTDWKKCNCTIFPGLYHKQHQISHTLSYR